MLWRSRDWELGTRERDGLTNNLPAGLVAYGCFGFHGAIDVVTTPQGRTIYPAAGAYIIYHLSP